MASTAAVTLKAPIIPIQSLLHYEELTTVKVENRWMDGIQQKSFKIQLPLIASAENKELLVYALDQFVDALDASRLNVTDPPAKYAKIRLIFGGDIALEWQRLMRERIAGLPNGAADLTDVHFTTDLNNLVCIYLGPTSFEDQREYLNTTVKPFNMSCEVLASRLRVVNTLSRYLPGSNNTTIAPNATAMKRLYYKMMPNSWKLEFAKSTRTLDDATYTLIDLSRFMAVHEAISKSSNKRPASSPSSFSRNVRPRRGRGRGFGRGSGGRGFGRGNFGRGYGTYGQGSYQNYGSPSYGGYPSTSYRTPPQGRGYGGYGSGGRSGGGRAVSPRSHSSGRGSGFGLRPRYASEPGGRGRGGQPPSFPSFYQEQYHQGGSVEPTRRAPSSARSYQGGRGAGRGGHSSSYFSEDMFFGAEHQDPSHEGHDEEAFFGDEAEQEGYFEDAPEEYDEYSQHGYPY